MTTLVDGTLDTQNQLSSSLLTTTMPIDGFLTLRELILHHPPGYATDIMRSMTFVKVPFAAPIRVRSDEIKVRDNGKASLFLRQSKVVPKHFFPLLT